MEFLKSCLNTLKSDIKTVLQKDPAAKSTFEVVLLYPGFHAILAHRIAHKLYNWGIPFFPRLISQLSRLITGIEIHPGATIGKNFFIDHGMGVVIGETCIIGDDVLIYQGVTLGGTGKDTGKRHPTVEDCVTIGAGATVLGNILVGKNSNIGAGSVVIGNVPENATVVGIPGRTVLERVFVQGQLMHNKIPDPVSKELENIKAQLQELQEKSQAPLKETTENNELLLLRRQVHMLQEQVRQQSLAPIKAELSAVKGQAQKNHDSIREIMTKSVPSKNSPKGKGKKR